MTALSEALQEVARLRDECEQLRIDLVRLREALEQICQWTFPATLQKVGDTDSFSGEARHCHSIASAALQVKP